MTGLTVIDFLFWCTTRTVLEWGYRMNLLLPSFDFRQLNVVISMKQRQFDE